jgi:hypothetical protein
MAELNNAQRAFRMLENETLWDIAEEVHAVLSRHGIAHAIVGGVAVCLHGYQRNTVDLDLLIQGEDSVRFQSALEAAGFVWNATAKEFRSPSGVVIQCVIAGEREGRGQEATFPNPGDAKHVTTIEGLPALSLAQLIQSKLACGLGDVRRTHKDFADVVELIAIHRLDGSFAQFLHKSLRKEFRKLVRSVGGKH